MDRRLGQIELRLGQTDELDRLCRCGRDEQRLRSAIPMSSDAWITMRRAMKRGSSPASSMRASQYTAASASEPRMLLMKALMTS